MPLTHHGTDRPGRVQYELSWWQISMMVVCLHLSALVSYAPMIVGRIPPVRDAWLASLVAWVPGLALGMVAWWLAKRFEGQNVFEYTFTIFGRLPGALLNAGIVVYLLYWAIVVTREFSVFMATVVYLRTPEMVLSLAFLILGAAGASQHMEFVGRTAELSGPLAIGGVFFLMAANIPNVDPGMLRPVLAEGWRAVAEQAITPAAIFGEVVWVALLAMPYVNKLDNGPKALGVGVGINVFFAAAGAAVLMATFGPELLSVMGFPTLSAARLVRFGESLERLEWLMLVLWIGAMGVKISLLLLGARQGVSSLLPRIRPGIVLLLTSATVLIGAAFALPTLHDVLGVFLGENIVWPILPLQAAPVVFAAVALLRGVGARGR